MPLLEHVSFHTIPRMQSPYGWAKIFRKKPSLTSIHFNDSDVESPISMLTLTRARRGRLCPLLKSLSITLSDISPRTLCKMVKSRTGTASDGDEEDTDEDEEDTSDEDAEDTDEDEEDTDGDEDTDEDEEERTYRDEGVTDGDGEDTLGDVVPLEHLRVNYMPREAVEALESRLKVTWKVRTKVL